jgi:hypothetical protein
MFFFFKYDIVLFEGNLEVQGVLLVRIVSRFAIWFLTLIIMVYFFSIYNVLRVVCVIVNKFISICLLLNLFGILELI